MTQEGKKQLREINSLPAVQDRNLSSFVMSRLLALFNDFQEMQKHTEGVIILAHV